MPRDTSKAKKKIRELLRRGVKMNMDHASEFTREAVDSNLKLGDTSGQRRVAEKAFQNMQYPTKAAAKAAYQRKPR
jgi:hypothetical protein